MVRAALGAGTGALRRTLLAESLVLCGTGAVLGVLLARPLVSVVGRYRRALLGARARRHGGRRACCGSAPAWRWPRPWCSRTSRGCPRRTRRPAPGRRAAACGITPGTNRRLRVFAVTQIALSFVLLAGAGMLLAALVALQTANTGYDLRQVLAIDVPLPIEAYGPEVDRLLSGGDAARSRQLPGVEHVAVGNFVPWRDAGGLLSGRRRSPSRVTRPRPARRTRARGCETSRPASSRRSASRSSPAATSPTTTGAAASSW